jgi:aminoglycoside/choline kinase family phosphotransferase
MKMNYQKSLITLYEQWSGEKVKSFTTLPLSGSERKYVRLYGNNNTAIGAFNPDERENRAFIYLSKHFLKNKLHVPNILSADLKKSIYLISDLGDTTLFSLIEKAEAKNKFSDDICEYYKTVITQLPKIQITASDKLDYSKCYPRAEFDRQSMLWDLNYFKYYFLKLGGISFDEQKLENDFTALVNFLLQADCKYFMYRDLNSRNIMILNNEPYFIDYQGGRKGPLQYDIASLLLDSKANIPLTLRDEFLNYYIESVKKTYNIYKRDFLKYYDGYVLIRLLQVFGAYGYRGYFEGKAHFLKSIPLAIKNLKWLLDKNAIKIKIPELLSALNQIADSKEMMKYDLKNTLDGKLTVYINSFSYRDKIPRDFSGHGGGFVFDCRAIPNPGRFDEYKSLNGRDKPVQIFLEEQHEAQIFLQDTFRLIDQSVEHYISRKWTNLMINYGCTGGQHRSVYSAEKLAEHLSNKYDINIVKTHIEQDKVKR